MVYVKGVPPVLNPTTHINPNKAPGQLPWIVRYAKDDGQSDEGTYLINDDPAALPVFEIPLANRVSLVSQQDIARETYDETVPHTRTPEMGARSPRRR